MSENTAILVNDVRKSFLMNSSGAASLKSALLWWRKRKLTRLSVLKGISFEVKRGECVAVIGRNGAGKSTLLSLIAKIYRPDSGSIKINGKVAPLLELGAGFHPDLSGAENIIFNAVVLGLTRKEAARRLPEIVAFSELGDQVYAPVRTYSSGMTARLGFAIAVHVDADILLVDEVLSVGDYEFQDKCVRKIQEFRKSGGTILVVSHSANALREVADRCIWIQHGEVHRTGTVAEILPEYTSTSVSDLRGAPPGPVKREAPDLDSV
jgi:ABC-type polysaccharide/polyol phosphate transport system ATPase subunit